MEMEAKIGDIVYNNEAREGRGVWRERPCYLTKM